MSHKPERCSVEMVRDPVTVWKLKLTGDCSDILKQMEELPVRKRRYLERRVEVEG